VVFVNICYKEVISRKLSSNLPLIYIFWYPISYLKGFLCAASGMLISLNDVIMLTCNLEKDDKW